MCNLMEKCKLKGLLKEDKKTNPIVIVLVVIGVIVLIAAIAYALYCYLAPKYFGDLEDEFEDEFDEDFFEDDEIVLVDDADNMFED